MRTELIVEPINENGIVLSNISDLIHSIEIRNPDVIVVEGYNGVGKSRVLKAIQDELNLEIYRPDYTSWANEIPQVLRWTIFSTFMDSLKYMNRNKSCHDDSIPLPVLMDRGFFSGVVYNNDIRLLKYYKNIAGDLDILHVLVCCTKEDYEKFLQIRDSMKPLNWTDCAVATERYRLSMKVTESNYIEFLNMYDEVYAEDSFDTCQGCSHYNGGKCCNPNSEDYLESVSPAHPRCSASDSMEVQDIR